MNENVHNLISWWKLKGSRETDPFVKFFFFYICFDAWLTSESSEDNDRNKIEWFINNENCLKTKRLDFWNSSQTRSLLNGLKNLSPIEDMRPNHRGNYVELNDTNDIGEVVSFIYQVRCNLFHGSKNPMVSRDANLVELSGAFLEKWIIWAHHKCS